MIPKKTIASISIFGLGYVGTVSAACFASLGHRVIGVDPTRDTVDMINRATSPIAEEGVAALMLEATHNGLLDATQDAIHAVMHSDISFICVGTPSMHDGSQDYTQIRAACTQIGSALRDKSGFHTVVVRSTLLPGTMRTLVIPLLESSSGKKSGIDFDIIYNPEFMREGSAVHDFMHPPKIIIGATDQRCGNLLHNIYATLPAEIIRCPIEVAEMLKYADNAWHATKIVFANEIGNLCASSGIDSHQVMNIFCQDTQLNLSPYYLKPGFAFGGSCLPKDVRALEHLSGLCGIETPLLNCLLLSNRKQMERGLAMIRGTGKHRIGFLGISFKAGTDDVRESPIINIIATLLAEDFSIRIYDPNVDITQLSSSNRAYLQSALPDIRKLMIHNMETLLDEVDVLVIGNNAAEFSTIAARLHPEQIVIDFIRIPAIETTHANYHGICW